MSYSAFPLPLSSSPPPLDALPPMLDDEEEDELNLSGLHSPTFDITGLSEKLPPTPKDSPVKVLPSTASSSSVAAAASLCSPCAPLSTPDVSPLSFPEREVTKLEENAGPTNDDDFGDFSNFQNNPASESVQTCQGYFEDISQNTRITDTSDDSQVHNHALDSRTSSHCINECYIENLPVPDDKLSGKKDLIIDKHRQIVNDKHYASDSDDESYCRFQKVAALVGPSDDNIHPINTSTDSGLENSTAFIEHFEDFSKSGLSNESDNCTTDCAGTQELETRPPEIDNSQAPGETDFGDFAAFSLEPNEGLTGLAEETSNTVDKPITSIPEETPFHDKLNDETLLSCQSSTDFEAFANFEGVSASDSHAFVPSFEASFEPILGSSLQSVGDASLNTFHDATPDTGFTAEVGVIADDVVRSCSLPTIEGASDISPEADDDFGYRDIDAEEDPESYCEGDQTRPRRDKREKVVVVEAKNKLVKCAEAQDSNEFNSGAWDHNSVEDEKVDSDDDEFDDFVVNTDAPTHDTDAVEFDEFASAKIDDAFGEFASDTRNGERSTKGGSFDDDDDDDDFGEFGTFNSVAGEVTVGEGRKCSVTGLARGTSVEARPGEGDPLLNRLESLVLKWITAPDCIKQSDQQQQPPQLLRDVVCGDAFVWRKLECVEWQSVVWSSSVAHQLMLTALNIDARNILYNQKWSSSVPLFAQSLSFSPLTPAKPSSMNSSSKAGSSLPSPRPTRQQGPIHAVPHPTASWNSVGGGSTAESSPPPLPRTEAVSRPDVAAVNSNVECLAATGSTGDSLTSESLDPFAAANVTGGDRHVPPPQFDWLASGLSNPLDQPAPSGDNGTVNGLSGVSSSGLDTHPALPTAVQQLLARCSATSTSTPLDQLSEHERRFLQGLPDISFMAAKVLMFPIVGSTD